MFPVATWTQPVHNLALQAALGVIVAWGPEIEGGSSVTPQQWCDEAKKVGLSVITKNQTISIPSNCIGFYHANDEPNQTGAGHVEPLKLKPEYDRLKLIAPNLPVFISLAGDKLLYTNFPNPIDRQLYLDYAKVCDAFTVNFYSKNRNASRYPTTQTALAVSNLIALCQKPVWAWVECNDQELGVPTLPDVNREPTPQEMSDTVDAAILAGASGFGWFGVCSRAKHGWPMNYWPDTNRNGVSMKPQYDMCRTLATKYNPQPSLESRVKALEDWRAKYFTM